MSLLSVKKNLVSLDIPPNHDQSLYTKLQEQRNILAQESNLPAYTILPNRSLRYLAAVKPKPLGQASLLPRLGSEKLKKIIPQFLAMIKANKSS